MVTPQSTEQSVATAVERLLDDLARHELTRDEHLARLEQEIVAYEKYYKIPSSDVHQRIEDGSLEEDVNVCDWLIALAILDHERG